MFNQARYIPLVASVAVLLAAYIPSASSFSVLRTPLMRSAGIAQGRCGLLPAIVPRTAQKSFTKLRMDSGMPQGFPGLNNAPDMEDLDDEDKLILSQKLWRAAETGKLPEEAVE
jgi:hypothetical protein